MKNLLMDPAFPDIVGEWAKQEACKQWPSSGCANDNGAELREINDPLLALVARAEIEATRIW